MELTELKRYRAGIDYVEIGCPITDEQWSDNVDDAEAMGRQFCHYDGLAIRPGEVRTVPVWAISDDSNPVDVVFNPASGVKEGWDVAADFCDHHYRRLHGGLLRAFNEAMLAEGI